MELLMLAVGDVGCVAVDLVSGAFVRGRWPSPVPSADPSLDDLMRVGFARRDAVDTRTDGCHGGEVDLTDGPADDSSIQDAAAGAAPVADDGEVVLRRPPGEQAVPPARSGSERLPQLVLAGRANSESLGSGTAAESERRPEAVATAVLERTRQEESKPRRERRRPLEPLCLATATVALDDSIPDPARPEAVLFEERPRRFPKNRPRLARRYLGGLLAPTNRPLLGFPAPAIRYWDLDCTRGSVAVVEVRGGPVLIRRPEEGDLVRARFEWGGLRHELPVVDSRLVSAMLGSERPQLSGMALHRRLGWWPRYLVVALTGPRDGYCYRVVASALRQP